MGSLFGMVVVAYCLELFFIRPSVLGVVDGLLPRLWFKNKDWGYSEWLRYVLRVFALPPRRVRRTNTGVFGGAKARKGSACPNPDSLSRCAQPALRQPGGGGVPAQLLPAVRAGAHAAHRPHQRGGAGSVRIQPHRNHHLYVHLSGLGHDCGQGPAVGRGMGIGRISANPAAPGNPTLRRPGARHARQRRHAGACRRTLLPRQGAAPSSVRRWSVFPTGVSVA